MKRRIKLEESSMVAEPEERGEDVLRVYRPQDVMDRREDYECGDDYLVVDQVFEDDIDPTGDDNEYDQEAETMIEPSPIDRRLKQSRSFNMGNWTSEELKKIYDGITTYGTTDKALEFISYTNFETRTFADIVAKVEELRDIGKEHREDRMCYEKEQWLRRGYRNVRPHASYVGKQKIDKQNRCLNHHVTRLAMIHTIENTPTPKGDKVVTVSDSITSRGYNRRTKLNWERIRMFFAAIVRQQNPLPGVNALEASIILSILDDIEDEAMRISDEDKAVIRGLLSNIQMKDLRNFEPDVPCDDRSGTQVHICLLYIYIVAFCFSHHSSIYFLVVMENISAVKLACMTALRTTIIHSHGKGEKKVAIAKNLCHENAFHILTEEIKVNRYDKASKFLNIVRQGRASNMLFTDEKILTVNPACNSQNNRQILQRGQQRSKKASIETISSFPSSVTLRWNNCMRIRHFNKTKQRIVEPKQLLSCTATSCQTFGAKTFGYQIRLIGI
uniref:SWIM-type domain-containing protein n=1 Tax=Heterorhabditis bacteriophora TaxID=37862 RepID=A0A1I7W6F2_HETBA